ncbi:hypothetical protein SRIMHP_16385 [Streptomyces rimosus subsp. rimosus]|uniref:Uncharacterized protein n=1 Tax=Streptomyces rimosus subsp. rimosus TaxID=132474 RepID=A0ABY3Z2Z0_STRRM|nr:hypothetical protein SRIMR7_18750 [Streptomyces rimosus subsp. rimosus]UTH95708.1 hypothetical protein SRIMHP_16385 [Streptomyces rimosus subsp. rimosus]UTJ13804.1 hypothetical protein SRIMDV3_16280 [Streptomyces rimosus subsp. rimosus]
MEVDGAALLVLGDLGEGHPGVLPERALSEAGALGDLPSQVDGEAPPEGTGVRVPEDGGFVVVGVGVECGAEGGVLLVVEGTAAAAADRTGRPGRAVVDRAEAGRGEGGEDAGVGGDAFRDAFAAAQAGGDQLEGVATVDLGAGRAAGGAAVVAADQEVTGREGGGVEVVEDVADLAGVGVQGVFGAVTVEADRVGAAAEAGELAQECGHGAEGGQFSEFGERGQGGGGDDGLSPSGFGWKGEAPGAADAWRYRGRPGGSVYCWSVSGGGDRGAASAGRQRRPPRTRPRRRRRPGAR